MWWVTVQFNSRCRTFISVCHSHPFQLSLAIPSWVDAVSASQRAVTLCGWGVKAGMVRVWLAGKTVWFFCYTRTVYEHFTDEGLLYKALGKCLCFLFCFIYVSVATVPAYLSAFVCYCLLCDCWTYIVTHTDAISVSVNCLQGVYQCMHVFLSSKQAWAVTFCVVLWNTSQVKSESLTPVLCRPFVTPRTPTPFKNALASLERQSGSVRVLVSFYLMTIKPARFIFGARLCWLLGKENLFCVTKYSTSISRLTIRVSMMKWICIAHCCIKSLMCCLHKFNAYWSVCLTGM